MIANVAAIVFTAALTGIGIWLAMTLADLRNTRDCVLMGRRGLRSYFRSGHPPRTVQLTIPKPLTVAPCAIELSSRPIYGI